ncbi:MAG TPA: GNAT family N-acetyltransferase [Propionicimonas sp.]|nr:GNAT family N-acetyltransferase [Propionicimonas sp.]
MPPLPSRWATDLAVLQLFGSTIEPHPDHLVVRTPANPDFHWGNFILVTDAEKAAEADRWLDVFADAHPQADWVAIGLITPPLDHSAWASHGLDVEVDEALSTRQCPTGSALPAGYQARRLNGADWESLAEVEIRDNHASGTYDDATHERFLRARLRAVSEASHRDALAYFGAFHGEDLVSSLGIVVCGRRARYQSVGTDSAHRRHGLAGHLLELAARWASDQGCDEWVIVTEATNPAGRLYRSVGFEPDVATASVYRTPPR